MKIENVVKIKIPNCLTTEEMTICLLGRLVNPKTLHTSNEIEMIHGWRCMVSEGDSDEDGGRIAAIGWRHDSINLCVKRETRRKVWKVWGKASPASRKLLRIQNEQQKSQKKIKYISLCVCQIYRQICMLYVHFLLWVFLIYIVYAVLSIIYKFFVQGVEGREGKGRKLYALLSLTVL